MNTRIFFLGLSALLLLMFSCANMKSAVYFNNVNDSVFRSPAADLEPVIQKNDLLSVLISSPNAEAALLFNTPVVLNANQPVGYLVDQEGLIQMPILGNVKVEGLTKQQLREKITNTLVTQKLLMEPVVNVRYLNYRVTVLGEVGRPSVVMVPSERITLLEALGYAGDLTINANRDRVMIIREEDTGKKVVRVNLNSAELFTSPYFFLKANDVVYVEPNKTKVASASKFNLVFPIVLSSLTFLLLVTDQVTR